MKRRPHHEQPVSHIDPIDDAEFLDEESEVGEEIRATITALMPWGISILAHVGLIVLAFFLVWQTIVKEEPRPMPPKSLTQSPDVTAYQNQIDEPEKMESSGGAFVTPVFSQVVPTPPKLPGVDQPVVFDQLTVPSDSGTGFGDAGDGVGGCGPIGLDPGSASEVVFLIDASGSMVDVLPFVINELKFVVNKMQPPATINNRPIYPEATIIFFSGKGVHEVPGGGGVKGMRPMTPAFKEQVREWVSLNNFNFPTGGRGNLHVEAALTRALGYDPELVILLSDNLTGGGQGATKHELMQDDLLDLIHKHNTAKPPARIDTIQFLYQDPLVRHGLQGTLNRIADETGGEYRFVSQSKLNLR